MEFSLVNKRTVRVRKKIRAVQKMNHKRLGRVKGKNPKTKIYQMVEPDNRKMMILTDISEPRKKKKEITLQSLLKRVEENGLTGMSGNRFPTVKKMENFLAAKNSHSILIINGVECDPGLLHDEWLMENKWDEIQEGIQILQSCFSFERVIVASKVKLEQSADGVDFVQVPDRYPMGYEKKLIEHVCGVSLTEHELPTENGILVLNVQTVVRIGQIMFRGNINTRYITVADMENARATVVKVSDDMNVYQILKKIYPRGQGNIYAGGGAMSVHLVHELEEMSKGINFIAWGYAPHYELAAKCKGCRACTKNCPMGISVHKIVQAVEENNQADISAYFPENCIGCSSCTYVCRAGKNIREIVKNSADALKK